MDQGQCCDDIQVKPTQMGLTHVHGQPSSSRATPQTYLQRQDLVFAFNLKNTDTGCKSTDLT